MPPTRRRAVRQMHGLTIGDGVCVRHRVRRRSVPHRPADASGVGALNGGSDDASPCHAGPPPPQARTLIDDLLAQRLLGLSHSWYDEDPPLLGRLVLQPLMWGGYAFMVWLRSLGNVSGAGPCWLLISICVTVYAVAALDKSLLDVFVANPFARNVHTQRATRREMRAVQREHLAPKTVGQAEIYDLIIVGVASLVRLAYMAMFVLYVFSFVATVCSALCNASSSSRESRWRRLTKRVKSGAEVVRRFAARLIGIPQEMELPVMLLVAAAIAILLNVVVATVVLRGPVNHAESMAEQLAEGLRAPAHSKGHATPWRYRRGPFSCRRRGFEGRTASRP